MKHLTILIPDGQSKLSSIVCTYKVFIKANAYWKEIHGSDLFKIQLAGISEEVEFYEGLFTVKPHTHISAIAKTDLIIVSALNNFNYPESIAQNKSMTDWITKQYKLGAEVATMCTGAFLLASTGLLDGRQCATHWAADGTFRAMFPKVNLQTDLLITDENGIYTNGGAFSFLNLILYLIEKYYDRRTAIYCSKIFQIEMDRNSQSPFIIFTGQKMHGDTLVMEAQSYIESNPGAKVSAESLAAKFLTGRRSFDRRFIKATGNTPLEYAQRVKVEMAKKAFETTRKTISEVMYEVGYTDVKAFREVFRKITGMSPIAYRSKYNKEAAV
ncbi:MAG: AraC family transcriptional regulator [Flavobacterium sp. BFFFF1]|uniref:GlxA family transcriptional regulator n=1 Tax=unclassified Flavobacterium TaxID=196869 RepID=UPI000BC7B4C9|nr:MULTISPECIES: helix-turn-helix domain-containing protein [unclassified Flavobacterium]OYU79693.1 MAG: AraC family transcriptional regulator [Flavobacterium sp. BFFFF1]